MHVGFLLQKRNGGFELSDGRPGGGRLGLFLRLLPVGGRDLGAPLLGLAQQIPALRGEKAGARALRRRVGGERMDGAAAPP